MDYPEGINFIVSTVGADLTLLEECLGAIEANKPSVPYTLTVVDDGHSLPVRDLCKAKGVPYVRTKMMFSGLSKAINQAYSLLEPCYSCVGILHDDVLLMAESHIDSIVKTLKERENIGIVVPKVLFPRLNIAHAFLVFNKNSEGQVSMNRPFYQWYRNHPAINVQSFVAAAAGGVFFVDRNFFDSIGGLDTQFFPVFFEDIDLCLSATSKGLKILYMPKAEVIHHTGVSINPERMNIQQIGSSNLQKLYEKWKDNEEVYCLEGVSK